MTTKQNLFLISIAYFLYAFLLSNYLLITSIGLTFSLYISLLFLFKLGKEVPLKELIILIASFQWIVGAKIGYSIGKVHYRYYMYVDEETYMGYVVPGVILFYLGLSIIKSNFQRDDLVVVFEQNRNYLLKIAKMVLVVGLSSFVISKLMRVPQLSFIFYLSSLLMYVAASYFMLIYPHRKRLIFLGALVFMFISSLQSGFFHDLIISAVFLVFILFSAKTTYLSKLSIITVGFAFLYIIQVVKSEYREIIWKSQGNVGTIAAFVEVLEAEFAPTASTASIKNLNGSSAEEEQNNINTRLNQGWIISKIMENVPKNQDYFGGSTITEAIESAILPRFLFPNKKGAEQAIINFKSMSGIDLNAGTSMGLSVIGEFYGNYGVVGGWLAMFIYGVFIAVTIKLLMQGIAGGSPIIVLWFLLFFFQVVKAETDFIKIINHLSKSILFFIFLKFALKMVNINLLPQKNESK